MQNYKNHTKTANIFDYILLSFHISFVFGKFWLSPKLLALRNEKKC